MKLCEMCVDCLLKKQEKLLCDERYIAEVKDILKNRKDGETAPYLVYLFSKVYKKYTGKDIAFPQEKERFNNFALSMEKSIEEEIEKSEDKLKTAFIYARTGNYIDFGAVTSVSSDTFISLLKKSSFGESDEKTYSMFLEKLNSANNFLLVLDNSGEVVLDKIFIKYLKKAYPNLKVTVMARGGEVLNDVTSADVKKVGLSELAAVVDCGLPVAGTVYHLLPNDAKKAVDGADVILAKGQGNFETMSEEIKGVFYSFLCKCEYFTEKFKVPQFTGMFIYN